MLNWLKPFMYGLCLAALIGCGTGRHLRPTAEQAVSASAVTSPQLTIELFTKHVNARELERLVDLYETSAMLVADEATRATGHDAIRTVMRGLFASTPQLQLVIRAVHVVGDIALVENQWKLTGTGPDGSAIADRGESAVVLRRQPDNRWRILIDRP